MDKRISSTGKSLLKNVIRHTGTHNRMVEETDMWQQHERDKQNTLESKYSFLKDTRLDMRHESTLSRRRAHMDEEPGQRRGSGVDTGNYWMKKLYTAEEADNDRWGHSGFKEMHPERFDSSDSSSTSSDERSRRHRKKKKKKHKRKKEHRKRKHNNSDTDDSRERKSRKHHKPSKRRKPSDNESGSDSVYGHYGDGNSDSEHEQKLKKHNRQDKLYREADNGDYNPPHYEGQSRVLHKNEESQSCSDDSSRHRQQPNGGHFTGSDESEIKVKAKKRKHYKRDERKKKKKKHKSRHKDDSDSVSD